MSGGLLARAASLAILALASACAGWSGADAPGVEAVRGDLEILVPATGVLEATQASPVAVPRVATGALKVKELAEEGSLVEEGQIVVVFDETQLSIELENERATLRSANRRVDRNELQRTIESGAIGVMGSVAELERDHVSEFAAVDPEVFSKIEILHDQVRATEAEGTIRYASAGLRLRGEYYDIEERILDVARTQSSGKIGRVETSLAQLVLKAPLGGMVVYKKSWRGSSAGVGDTLWPGNMIMSIVDPASVALKAWVLERDAPGIAAGAPAEIIVDAFPGRTFHGKVKSVADLASPIERGSPVKYFETWVDLVDGDPALLRPGMKARVTITAGTVPDAIIIPRAAVGGTPEQPRVVVSGRSGIEERAVKLGDGDAVRVAVIEGVAAGERVLVGEGAAPREAAEPGGGAPARGSDS